MWNTRTRTFSHRVEPLLYLDRAAVKSYTCNVERHAGNFDTPIPVCMSMCASHRSSPTHKCTRRRPSKRKIAKQLNEATHADCECYVFVCVWFPTINKYSFRDFFPLHYKACECWLSATQSNMNHMAHTHTHTPRTETYLYAQWCVNNLEFGSCSCAVTHKTLHANLLLFIVIYMELY